MERTLRLPRSIDISLRGLAALGLYALSCTPAVSTPSPMPEKTPHIPNPEAIASGFSSNTIYFPPDNSILTPPEPVIEMPKIIDIPGFGRFRLTDTVLEGEASTYSREGCLGCRIDRKMYNEDDLDDSRLTLATLLDKIPIGSLVLVENISDYEKDPNKNYLAVARVTDTGGFAELGRIADLTLTTNHYVLEGEPLPPDTKLKVRLTAVIPEPIPDNPEVFLPELDALAS